MIPPAPQPPAPGKLQNHEDPTGFTSIYDWAKDNGRPDIQTYIEETMGTHLNMGLSSENFLYNPKTKKIKIILPLDLTKHKGHSVEYKGRKIILSHGGVSAFLSDVAPAALVFTQSDPGDIPVTVQTNITNTDAEIFHSGDIVIESEIKDLDFTKSREAKIATKIFQGDILCGDIISTINSIPVSVLARKLSKRK